MPEELRLDDALASMHENDRTMPDYVKMTEPSEEEMVDWSVARHEQAPSGQSGLESFGKGLAGRAAASARGHLKTVAMTTGIGSRLSSRLEAGQRYAGNWAMPQEMSGKIAHLLGSGTWQGAEMLLSAMIPGGIASSAATKLGAGTSLASHVGSNVARASMFWNMMSRTTGENVQSLMDAGADPEDAWTIGVIQSIGESAVEQMFGVEAIVAANAGRIWAGPVAQQLLKRGAYKEAARLYGKAFMWPKTSSAVAQIGIEIWEENVQQGMRDIAHMMVNPEHEVDPQQYLNISAQTAVSVLPMLAMTAGMRSLSNARVQRDIGQATQMPDAQQQEAAFTVDGEFSEEALAQHEGVMAQVYERAWDALNAIEDGNQADIHAKALVSLISNASIHMAAADPSMSPNDFIESMGILDLSRENLDPAALRDVLTRDGATDIDVMRELHRQVPQLANQMFDLSDMHEQSRLRHDNVALERSLEAQARQTGQEHSRTSVFVAKSEAQVEGLKGVFDRQVDGATVLEARNMPIEIFSALYAHGVLHNVEINGEMYSIHARGVDPDTGVEIEPGVLVFLPGEVEAQQEVSKESRSSQLLADVQMRELQLHRASQALDMADHAYSRSELRGINESSSMIEQRRARQRAATRLLNLLRTREQERSAQQEAGRAELDRRMQELRDVATRSAQRVALRNLEASANEHLDREGTAQESRLIELIEAAQRVQEGEVASDEAAAEERARLQEAWEQVQQTEAQPAPSRVDLLRQLNEEGLARELAEMGEVEQEATEEERPSEEQRGLPEIEDLMSAYQDLLGGIDSDQLADDASFEDIQDFLLSRRTTTEGETSIVGQYLPEYHLSIWYKGADAADILHEWVHHIQSQGLMPAKFAQPLYEAYLQVDERTGVASWDKEGMVDGFLSWIKDNELPAEATPELVKAFGFMRQVLAHNSQAVQGQVSEQAAQAFAGWFGGPVADPVLAGASQGSLQATAMAQGVKDVTAVSRDLDARSEGPLLSERELPPEVAQSEAYMKGRKAGKLIRVRDDGDQEVDYIPGDYLFRTEDGDLIAATRDPDLRQWDLESVYDSRVSTFDEGSIRNPDALQRLSEELTAIRRNLHSDAMDDALDFVENPETDGMWSRHTEGARQGGAAEVVSDYRFIEDVARVKTGQPLLSQRQTLEDTPASRQAVRNQLYKKSVLTPAELETIAHDAGYQSRDQIPLADLHQLQALRLAGQRDMASQARFNGRDYDQLSNDQKSEVDRWIKAKHAKPRQSPGVEQDVSELLGYMETIPYPSAEAHSVARGGYHALAKSQNKASSSVRGMRLWWKNFVSGVVSRETHHADTIIDHVTDGNENAFLNKLWDGSQVARDHAWNALRVKTNDWYQEAKQKLVGQKMPDLTPRVTLAGMVHNRNDALYLYLKYLEGGSTLETVVTEDGETVDNRSLAAVYGSNIDLSLDKDGQRSVEHFKNVVRDAITYVEGDQELLTFKDEIVRNAFERVRPELARVHKDITGKEMGNIPLYLPSVREGGMMANSDFLQEQYDAMFPQAAEARRNAEQRMEARNPGAIGKRLNTDVIQLVRSYMQQADVYIAKAQSLHDMESVLRNAKVHEQFAHKGFSNEHETLLKFLEWERYANGRGEVSTQLDNLVDNTTSLWKLSILAGNVPVTLRQAISLPTGMAMVPTRYGIRMGTEFMRNIKDAAFNLHHYGDPLANNETRQLMEKYSPKHARGVFDAVYDEVVSTWESSKLLGKEFNGKSVARWMMQSPQIVDAITRSAVWRGAFEYGNQLYRDGVRTDGQVKTEAARFADKITDRTQPGVTPSDRPLGLRGKAWKRALLPFQTQLLNEFNIMLKDEYRPMKRAWRDGGAPAMFQALIKADKGKTSVGHKILFTHVLPAYFLGALLRGRFLRPEEPEDWNTLMNDIFTFGVMKSAPVVGPLIGSRLIYGRAVDATTPYLELQNNLKEAIAATVEGLRDDDKAKLEDAGINAISIAGFTGTPKIFTDYLKRLARDDIPEGWEEHKDFIMHFRDDEPE